MTEYEWLTCEDVHKMGPKLFLKHASLVLDAIYSNGLLCELPNPNSMCIHYWHEAGCYGASFEKKHQPLVCDLIREVVGNPFRPIYHVKDHLNDPRASYHVQATAQTSTKGHQELIKELNNRVFLPEWLTPRVRSFAQGVIESERYSDVPALADLLEEAGCDNEEILRHLRQEERCPEWLVKPIDEWGETKKCSSLTRHTCNSGWITKPVPCQAGCWALRLLTGVTK